MAVRIRAIGANKVRSALSCWHSFGVASLIPMLAIAKAQQKPLGGGGTQRLASLKGPICHAHSTAPRCAVWRGAAEASSGDVGRRQAIARANTNHRPVNGNVQGGVRWSLAIRCQQPSDALFLSMRHAQRASRLCRFYTEAETNCICALSSSAMTVHQQSLRRKTPSVGN